MMNNKLYSKVRATRDEPNSNPYARIHVLFHELAILQMKPGQRPQDEDKSNLLKYTAESFQKARLVKQFWKDFFGIKSLKDLTDERLHEIEDFLEKKIQYEHERRFGV